VLPHAPVYPTTQHKCQAVLLLGPQILQYMS